MSSNTDHLDFIPNLVANSDVAGPWFELLNGSGYVWPFDTRWWHNECLLRPDSLHDAHVVPGYSRTLDNEAFRRARAERVSRYLDWEQSRRTKLSTFRNKIQAQLNCAPTRDDPRYRKAARLHDITASYPLTATAEWRYHIAQSRKEGRTIARHAAVLTYHLRGTRTQPDDVLFKSTAELGTSPRIRNAVQYNARNSLPVVTRNALEQWLKGYERMYCTSDNDAHAWKCTIWDRDEMIVALSKDHPGAADAWGKVWARLPHVSRQDPTQVAYYESFDKLVRGIETRTKPGRFLTRFFGGVLPESVIRDLAAAQVAATAPKVMHIAKDVEEIVMAIDEGPSESCQSWRYWDTAEWYRGHKHPAYAYGSGDFVVLYLTDDNKPADPERIESAHQRITARVLCNAKTKEAARIYGDRAALTPLMEAAGYSQATNALVGCRLEKIESRHGNGYLMPYVDAGTASGGGSLDAYDDGAYFVLCTDGDIDTYAGYNNKGVVDPEGEVHTCPHCGSTHRYEDDIYYSDYENMHYCTDCDEDFVNAVIRRGRYGRERDTVLRENAIEIGDDYYLNDAQLLSDCGFVQCIHCDEWAPIDDTTSTESGQVCDECSDQVVTLAEASPDGYEYGYEPDCTQYIDTHTGETVWLDDTSDLDDYTNGDGSPRYVTEDEYAEMQDEAERRQMQSAFEFVGPVQRTVWVRHIPSTPTL